MRGLRWIAVLAAVAALAGCGPKAGETERKTPSGLPVPRYVSLKFDEVRARSGPSDDHRELWTYHARGLPLQVVAETVEWRRVCDPDGGLSWVHMRTVTPQRTVIRLDSTALPLLAQPKADAKVVAYLAPRATAAFDRCDKGWCRLHVGRVRGWAPQEAIWGTADAPQCPKPAASAPPP